MIIRACVAAGLRVTKALTPPATRNAYQGVKPSIGADSYHMSFLKSVKKAWGDSGSASKEVRL